MKRGMAACTLLLLAACAPTPMPEPDAHTPLGIALYGPADPAEVDRRVTRTTDCLARHGWAVRHDFSHLTVEAVCDRPCPTGAIDCDVLMGGTWVHGYAVGDRVVVTPSLAALSHEVVHWHGYAEGEGGNEHPAVRGGC